jgi:hypothetical protein
VTASLPRPRAAPELATARRFVDFMAEGEAITLQTFFDRRGRGGLAVIRHGMFDEHAGELVSLNENGAGVFWMVNYGDGRGRGATNVTGVRALFVDLDGDPLAPVLAAPLEPHAIVESSPERWHAYWLVDGCPLDQFSRWQKAMAARFNGDPTVHDLPRVMRLPGFVHHKGAPFVSRLVELKAMQPYGLDELVGSLELTALADEERPRQSAAAKPRGDAGKEATIAEGGRNAALAVLAGKLRRDGLSAAAIEAALLATNAERCRPPLDAAEVQRIARSIGRYAAGPIEAPPAVPASTQPASAASTPPAPS